MTQIISAIIFLTWIGCKEEKKPYVPPEVFDVDESATIPKPSAHRDMEEHLKTEARKQKAKNIALKEPIPDNQASQELVALKIQKESDDEAALIREVTRALKSEDAVPESENRDYKQELFSSGFKAFQRGDTKRAKALYLEACQVGHYHACHKFAYFEQRDGNFKNAIRFYKLSCKHGIFKSCNNLAFGSEQIGDLERAKDYYSKACINHHEISCKNLRRVLIKEQLAL